MVLAISFSTILLGSSVPFTLPLINNGIVSVYEDLLDSCFDFQLGIMYVEQELYMESGLVSNPILMQQLEVKMVHVGRFVHGHTMSLV